MQQVGRQLREARERLGLSIDDISRRTKIKARILRAIEEGNTALLPGGFYARGFLRAYPREVGCDVEKIIQSFRGSAEDGDAHAVLLKRLEAEQRRRKAAPSEARRAFGAQAAYLAVLAMFGGSLYLAWNREATVPSPLVATTIATPVETFTPSREVSQPVGTSGVKAPAPAARKPVALTLDIQPTSECWLSATADGQRVIFRLLNAGERMHIEAADAVDLRVGDPAVFAFTLNGQAARVTGTAGEAVDVRITPDNYRQFLAP